MGLVRAVLPFIATVAIAYGLLSAWVFFTQRGQIYFPTPESQHLNAEQLWIESQGERIKVWVVARPGGRALLYFGGNAEDVAGNIESFAEAFADRSLYLVNYRGYGGSSGRPSEAGLVGGCARGVRSRARTASGHCCDGAKPGERRGGAARRRAAGRTAGAGDAVRQPGERGEGTTSAGCRWDC